MNQPRATPTLKTFELLANDLADAYGSGDADAMQRLMDYTGATVTLEGLRARVRQQLNLMPGPDNRGDQISVADAQQLLARMHSFKNWEELTRQIAEAPHDPRLVPPGDRGADRSAGGDGRTMRERIADPPQNHLLFREAVRALEAGDFSLIEALFEKHPSVPGSQCPIIEWYEEGYFADEPRVLAEALTCACMLGKTDVAAFLLTQGVDPLAGISTGLNGFHYAASSGHLDTVMLLIERKAPLEVRNMYGGTVLGQAVWSAINETGPDHIRIIEVLLEAGANIEAGCYPTGDEVVDEVLRRHGAT